MSDSVTPWTVPCLALLSMEYSKARILEWVAISNQGDLPHPGIEPASLVSPVLADGLFTTEPSGKTS